MVHDALYSDGFIDNLDALKGIGLLFPHDVEDIKSEEGTPSPKD